MKDHGHGGNGTQSPTYKSWAAMKNRCDNPAADAYRYYGARGITYDVTWADFKTFLADMGERPSGTSLDRVDGSLDYTPSNCRWSTRVEQARNKRNNRMLTHGGTTKCAAEWEHDLGMKPGTIYRRMVVLGWGVERTLGCET